MSKGQLQQIHPVLAVRNVAHSVLYYVEKLGFTIAFADKRKKPHYACVRRDGIEIHLQSHSLEAWERMTASSLRIVVRQIDDLFIEFQKMEVFHPNTQLKETPWGTKEFAFYDPDMNGLTFYTDL